MVLVLFAGCTGSPASTPQAYYDEYERALCSRRYHCDGGGAGAQTTRAIVPESNCASAHVSFPSQLAAFLHDGSVTFDASIARSCLDQARTSCSNLPACRGVFVGTIPVEGACSDDLQCVSGACSGSTTTCGACLALALLGQACGGGVECEEGTHCPGGAAPTCTAGTNRPAVESQVGETCEDNATTQYFCARDLYCDSNNVCSPRLGAGISCQVYEDSCALGTVCAGPLDDAHCRTTTTTSVEGASCGLVGTSYVVCRRDQRLFCEADATCKRLAGDGEDGSECRGGLDCDSHVCDGSRRTCVAGELADAEPCTFDMECASQSCPASGAGSSCAAVLTCR